MTHTHKPKKSERESEKRAQKTYSTIRKIVRNCKMRTYKFQAFQMQWQWMLFTGVRCFVRQITCISNWENGFWHCCVCRCLSSAMFHLDLLHFQRNVSNVSIYWKYTVNESSECAHLRAPPPSPTQTQQREQKSCSLWFPLHAVH